MPKLTPAENNYLAHLFNCPDPKKVMVKLENEQLDILAAQIQEWKLVDDGVATLMNDPWDAWEDKNGNRRDRISYKPSRNLNQAYELIEKFGMHQRLHAISGDYRHYLFPEDGRWVPCVLEKEAGSHSRAVVILAALGKLA